MSSPNLNIVTLLGSGLTYTSAYLFGIQEQSLPSGDSVEKLIQVSGVGWGGVCWDRCLRTQTRACISMHRCCEAEGEFFGCKANDHQRADLCDEPSVSWPRAAALPDWGLGTDPGGGVGRGRQHTLPSCSAAGLRIINGGASE